MNSPLSSDKWGGTYEKLYGLAEDLTVEFDAGATRLSSEKDNAADRIFDEVDDIYVHGVEAEDLDYKEVQVLAAIAVIEASEFDTSEDILPADRSRDG